ncbi:MAG: hypothetical protein HY397_01215 [Candidatus Doudnabacteria bacterium]|nr:hypothetical protein [Candidatus Doudnabacteria bacterium]
MRRNVVSYVEPKAEILTKKLAKPGSQKIKDFLGGKPASKPGSAGA